MVQAVSVDDWELLVTFKVGLLGLGTVGTGTAQILLDPAGRQPLLQELELARVGVRNLDKPRSIDLPSDRLTTDLESITQDPAIDIVVELLGGLEPARSLILSAIAHGKHVVTANKAVIARYGEEIFAAAADAGVYVLLEAAVGGGIPVIEPLKQSLCANRIQGILGIVNGTTNYILTRMQREGGDFGPILADAQRLGYAEADPTADVDGWDAADKIAILASLAFGGRVEREQITCEGIRAITASDIAYAERLGFTIKLLAKAKRQVNGEAWRLEASVYPTLVPLSHPLASVNDVYNAILVEGDPVGQVMFFGPGAGAGPTASAVVADILNIAAILSAGGDREHLDPLLACNYLQTLELAPPAETAARFYLRIVVQDSPGVIGKVGTIFGEQGISLESIVQTDVSGDTAELVVITHQVQEGIMRQALAELESLPLVQSIANLLHVL